MLFKVKNFAFLSTYARYDQIFNKKIVQLKMIYKFYCDNFSMRCIVFVLKVKSCIKNLKKSFSRQTIQDKTKYCKLKLFILKRSTRKF